MQFEDQYKHLTLFNLNTGKWFHGLTSVATIGDPWRPPVFSPDQRHVAYQYETENAIRLAMQPASAFNSRSKVLRMGVPIDGHDYIWSPDGRWLAYLWQDSASQTFLSLTDDKGNEQSTVAISTPPNNLVSLNGWSGDGKYVALSISTDSNNRKMQREISIWSMPELKLIKAIPHQTTLSAIPDTIQWGSQGNWLAFLTLDADSKASVSLYSPAADRMQTYQLGELMLDDGIDIRWSLNGQYVAVVINLGTDVLVGSANIFGTDGTALYKITDKMHNDLVLASGGVGWPLSWWSADGKSLLFTEQLPNKSNTIGALVAYRVDQQRKITLQPRVYMNPQTTDDHRYLYARFSEGDQDRTASAPFTGKDHIIVVDTNTLATTVVDALNGEPGPLQIEGTYSAVTGWLVLMEDEISTWALNVLTGVKRPLAQGYISAPLGTGDIPFVVSLARNKTKTMLHLTGLQDGATQDIDLAPDQAGPRLTAVSPDGKLVAIVFSTESTFSEVPFSIFRNDGKVQWHLDNLPLQATNLQFTSCGG